MGEFGSGNPPGLQVATPADQAANIEAATIPVPSGGSFDPQTGLQIADPAQQAANLEAAFVPEGFELPAPISVESGIGGDVPFYGYAGDYVDIGPTIEMDEPGSYLGRLFSDAIEGVGSGIEEITDMFGQSSTTKLISDAKKDNVKLSDEAIEQDFLTRHKINEQWSFNPLNWGNTQWQLASLLFNGWQRSLQRKEDKKRRLEDFQRDLALIEARKSGAGGGGTPDRPGGAVKVHKGNAFA